MELRRSALVAAPLGLALILGSSALVTSRRSARSMSAATARAAQFAQELSAQEHRRVTAAGEGEEGLAWENYNQALEQVASLPRGRVFDLMKAAVETAKVSEKERAASFQNLVQELGPALQALRAGAGCLDAQPPLDFTQAGVEAGPRLFTTNCLTNALTVAGLATVEAGDPEEGAAMMLDAMQVGRDYQRAPLIITQLIGVDQLVSRSLEAFGEHQGIGQLAPPALALLDAGILRLLNSVPPAPDFRGELVLFIEAAKQAGFVVRGRLSRGFLELAELIEGSRDQPLLSLYTDLTELKRQSADTSVLHRVSSLYASSVVSHRLGLVRLQMLHYAIRVARGLEPMPFRDPFGEELQATVDGDHLVLRVENPTSPKYPFVKRYHR